jgi:acetyl-CoA carboxylase carboxyltransferase component
MSWVFQELDKLKVYAGENSRMDRSSLEAPKRLDPDMKELVQRVIDQESFLETRAPWAPNILIGFGRLKGHSVGVVANQPKHYAGALDNNSSAKAARLIRFCDDFNIPVLTFVDVPGFLPSVDQEHGGIIKNGVKLLYAYCEATK